MSLETKNITPNSHIFLANIDMEASISDAHLGNLELLINTIKAILNAKALSMDWFVYRPGRSDITESAIDIQATNGNSVSLTIHIDEKNIYPNYVVTPQPYRKTENLELTVSSFVDIHHLTLWIASELDLKVALIENQGATFFSSLG